MIVLMIMINILSPASKIIFSYIISAYQFGFPVAKQGRKERKNRTFATLEGLELKWNKNIDGTHIRTYLAYDLFEKNNYLAPNCTLSQVLITEFGVLQNLGIFELNEPVDEIFLSKHLDEADLGGDLYKVGWDNRNGGNLTTDTLYGIGIEDEHAGYFPIYDLKTNKKTSSNESLKNLINTLNSNINNIENVVDIDMFLKFAAISYLVGNPDDYRNNYNNYSRNSSNCNQGI